MAVKKVDTSVVTSSFNEDNYARRMLKRVADTVNNNADELDVISSKVNPLQLWGTYTSEVDSYFPANGITKADFTKVASMPELAGASAILIIINGISVGSSTDYGNKSFEFTVYGSNSSTLAKATDENDDMTYEYFKLGKELTGECVFEIGGRAPTNSNNPNGFYKKMIGLNTGVVMGAINIQDFKIVAGTNLLTQNVPLNISVYVAY